MHGRGVLGHAGSGERFLALEEGGVERAHEPEVEESDTAVVEQQVVAGVGVAAHAVEPVEQREVEAEHDLAEAVALGLIQLLDLREPPAAQQLGHEYAAAGERRVDARHEDERMATGEAVDRPVVRASVS